MRGFEMRFRQLFEASGRPVLLLDFSELRIVQVNRAAARALGVQSGEQLVSELRENEREGFVAMLARVYEHGSAPDLLIHVRADRKPWLVRASLFAANPMAFFLLELRSSGSATYLISASAAPSPAASPSSDPPPDSLLTDLLARLPEPLIVLRADGTIAQANRAFLELVAVKGEEHVVGRHLDEWLVTLSACSCVSAASLIREIERYGAVRDYTAAIRGDRGEVSYVTIAAVGDSDGNPRFVCLLLRRLDRVSQDALVLAAVSVVERLCLEAVVRLPSRTPEEK